MPRIPVDRPDGIADSLRRSLLERIARSQEVMVDVAMRGFDHWIVTYSGGKDSTAALCVALEAALNANLHLSRVDVIYTDSLLEIPTIRNVASEFLAQLGEMNRLRDLPIVVTVALPKLQDRFWVNLLGKGYPPPHQRFRWCTRRLKITPVAEALRDVITHGRTVIVTGVRFSESKARAQGLMATCRNGGECGQGMWFFEKGRVGAAYLAPIVEWETCDVWDYLNLVAPTQGYSTSHLESTYGTRDTRFGCWTCSVVRQERSLAATVQREEYRHLEPLVHFRRRLWDATRSSDSREPSVGGRAGRLSLVTRRQLLDELLQLQHDVGESLIDPFEVKMIKSIWLSSSDQAGVSTA